MVINDRIPLDTVGKLSTTPIGNRYILTMQDNFSKLCIAVPIPDLKTETIAHAIAQHLIAQYETMPPQDEERVSTYSYRL